MRTFETKKEKGETNKKQHPGTKPESQKSQWCGGESTGPDPSPGEGLRPGPPAVAARVVLTGRSGLPGAGAVVTTCLGKLGTTFGIVQYQKNAVPKAAVFRSLHGCEVDLYVKLSHSGLSKNIMCLA